MLTRLKLPISPRMLMPPPGYARRIAGRGNSGNQGARIVAVGRMKCPVGVVADPAVQSVQRLGHSFPGQSAHIDRLGLREELGDISCGHRVFLQARFKPLQSESRQHQQPRGECN